MKRDLNADLAICLVATPGPWRLYGGKFGEMNIYAHPYGNDDEIVSDIDFDRTHDAQFIAEAREGWPEAIRRAIAAEAEVDRLRTELMTVYQRAQNDIRRRNGGMCVGTRTFADYPFAERLVHTLGQMLFPEVSANGEKAED